jgi:aldehyde:ferredoxin oxidoreductase
MSSITGKVLTIDISTGELEESSISDETLLQLLGSRGINARILWDLAAPDVLPLSPESALIFGAGTLNATAAPSAGRLTLTFKSPATGRYFKSSAGGHFGPAMRRAGISNLVVRGRAERPVYLFIDDGKIDIRDASSLWGKDARSTTRLIREELKDGNVQVACIGPGGENGVVFAGVMFSTYNIAARGGGGAVMGCKNLKAIAVRGSKSVPVKNPEAFLKSCIRYRQRLAQDHGAQALYKYGTAGLVDLANEARALPSYNFKEVRIPNADRLGGYHLEKAGYLTGRVGCSSCTISCHRFTRIRSGPYAGTYSAGPEFETASALGSGCGISDTEILLKANELCNLYGLDTISTGAVIQWAMECYERGILSDVEIGFPLGWGDGERMLQMIENIALRKGFGDLLAKGLKQAAQNVGRGSEDFAVQARGLEQSRVDTRVKKGNALAFAVNPRGPDHLHSQVIAENGRTPEAVALIEKITGDRKYASALLSDKRAEIVRWHEDCYAATDSLGFCSFATTLAYAITPSAMAEMFHLASGFDMSEKSLLEGGERIVVLEHSYNVREGLHRQDHTLPKRLMSEPVKEGPGEGHRNSPEELNRMLDEYYTLHDWDPATSWPTRRCLERLGLAEVYAVLKAIGKTSESQRSVR